MNCVKKDSEFDLFYIRNQYSGMQQVNEVLQYAVIVKCAVVLRSCLLFVMFLYVCCTGIRVIVFPGSLDNTVKQILMNVLAIRVPMAVFVWTLWMDSSVSVHVVTMMHAASVMWMSVPAVPARMEERARMG